MCHLVLCKLLTDVVSEEGLLCREGERYSENVFFCFFWFFWFFSIDRVARRAGTLLLFLWFWAKKSDKLEVSKRGKEGEKVE